MSKYDTLRDMILRVASALGPDMREQVAFVGGCTTGLHITDEFAKESVRHTDDVDLIISVIGKAGWAAFQEQLRSRGFSVAMDDDVVCRMRLEELQVDFMPDDAAVLGFSNRWYGEALATAQPYALDDTTDIRLVSPPYFVATKLEAYKGRGNDDPLASRDIEDILSLVDGRESLNSEVTAESDELRRYIAAELRGLLEHPEFEYAVQSTANHPNREKILFERLEALVVLGGELGD